MLNKIRLGIIGIGRMGITHYSIINKNPGVVITAVADNSSLVLNIIKKYINDIHVYNDFNELLDNEKLDAILICTPPSLHYKVALKAAEKGLHVFSEKPFTIIQKQADELATIFERNHLVNQVGYVNRFNDIFRTVKEHIKAGIIGDIILFKSEMYSRTITKSEEGHTWRDSREKGGGAVFEMASHAIDLVNYIIGKPDKVKGSILRSIFSKNVEDAVSSTFIYENGIYGTLSVNWSDESYRKPTNKIEIFGSKGKILADQHGFKIYLKKELPEYDFFAGWNTRYITNVFKPVPFYVRGNEYTSQLFHFVDCINNKEMVNCCSFRNATDTHEVIAAIFNDFDENSKL